MQACMKMIEFIVRNFHICVKTSRAKHMPCIRCHVEHAHAVYC